MTTHGRGARVHLVLVACGVLILGWSGFASAASSNGAGTTHQRQIFHGTQVFFDLVPCHPDLGGYKITASVNSQFHDTENANGDWVTGTAEGAFRATPIEFRLGRYPDGSPKVIPIRDSNGHTIPRAGETFTGHFQNWFGGSINRRGSVFTSTFNVWGAGSAGTTFRLHDNNHIVFGPGEPFSPATVVKVSFDKARCG